MEISRHFTATVYIVYNNKILLHKHIKYNKWLPVGGHIDINELPEEAAIREAKEESGLEIELVDISKDLGLDKHRVLNAGQLLNLHKVNDYHEHIDFSFFARANSGIINPGEGESGDVRWFSKSEIDRENLDKDVKVLSELALETLKN